MSLMCRLLLSITQCVYTEVDTLAILPGSFLCQWRDITALTAQLCLFKWHCVTFSAKWSRPHSGLRRHFFVMYSRHPDTFTGPFFNEKEAKLVRLVLPAGCHYAPLESSLRDSAEPIVPKVPQLANWEAWLPLSAFTARTCLRDWFPRQRRRMGNVFPLCALLEKTADRVIREFICLYLSKALDRCSSFMLILPSPPCIPYPWLRF